MSSRKNSNKKSNSKTPSKIEIVVEETTPKKQTPKNKSAVASVSKKETPKVKAAPIEGFFLLDALKAQGVDDIQTETQDSLLTILTQALQSNDVSALDSCFENQDNTLIENTVKKVPQNKVIALFEKIAERVENGKKSNYNFLAWLSSLIRNHSTFLLKLPEISTQIAPLIALLQKRALAVEQIHRLKGKIDMVLKVETEVIRTKKVQKVAASEQKSGILYAEEDEEVENTKKAKKAAAKGGKKQGYTKAMEDLEDIEGEEEDFGGEDFEEEEDDEDEENGDYDAYLNGGGDDFEGGEDDEEDFDEDEEGDYDDDDENAFDME